MWIARAQEGKGLDKVAQKIWSTVIGDPLLGGSLTPEKLAKAVDAMKQVSTRFYVLTAYKTLIGRNWQLPTLDEIRNEITSQIGTKKIARSTIHHILREAYKLPLRPPGRPW